MYFNSIKVRLKLANSLYKNAYNVFQFHKGTIKTHRREAKYQKFANFNSIKVRLKLRRGSSKRNVTTFQFHKGTIKTELL